jgi:hypothetical protein
MSKKPKPKKPEPEQWPNNMGWWYDFVFGPSKKKGK